MTVLAQIFAVVGNYVARGAVDLAVWDLVGQILGCPCHTLLGGFADDVAAAHMVSFGEPVAMAAIPAKNRGSAALTQTEILDAAARIAIGEGACARDLVKASFEKPAAFMADRYESFRAASEPFEFHTASAWKDFARMKGLGFLPLPFSIAVMARPEATE